MHHGHEMKNSGAGSQNCVKCGACYRGGRWWLYGYSQSYPPRCTQRLTEIEAWAALPVRERHSALPTSGKRTGADGNFPLFGPLRSKHHVRT